MTAKCHPAGTVWGEGHGGVPAMGVVRLLGKQQPDKQCRLAPITETAAQATEAKGQKGKIAKRIFFPAALNRDSVLLLLSPDIDGHDGVPRAIQSPRIEDVNTLWSGFFSSVTSLNLEGVKAGPGPCSYPFP